MGWFKRLREGIQTATQNKREAPDGLWYKCTSCAEASTMKELSENYYKCPKCNYHVRIGSHDYFDIIFDGRYKLHFEDLEAVDYLGFSDLKDYDTRLVAAKKKTKLPDALQVAQGKVNKLPLVIAAMDFSFIGGSMGSVVGEKISRAVDICLETKTPLLIISKSGGARMMESARVIKETIKKDLPEGFQRSEFLQEAGFLDRIVDRKDLQQMIADLLGIFAMKSEKSEASA